jgi:hypothetical protein
MMMMMMMTTVVVVAVMVVAVMVVVALMAQASVTPLYSWERLAHVRLRQVPEQWWWSWQQGAYGPLRRRQPFRRPHWHRHRR